VVRLDLLELLLLFRLLHVDRIVVEPCNVLGSVDDLAGLEVVDGLRCSLSVLAELLQVVDRHQNSRKLRYLAQLLARSLLLSILKLALIIINLLRLSFKFTYFIVEQHYAFVHLLLVIGQFKAFVPELGLFFL